MSQSAAGTSALPITKKRKPESLRRRIVNWSVYRTFKRAYDDCKPSGPVLLAPCGFGWFFQEFRQDEIPIVGVDIETHKVTAARAKVEPPVTVHEENILSMPFSNGQFDMVISNRFLLHFNDDFRARAMKELARVTGRYLLVHYDSPLSIRNFMRHLRFAKAPEKDFSTYEGYRVWKRHGRKLRYTRKMMESEGAPAGLKVVRVYPVCTLLSERVYCLYQKEV